MTVCGPRLVAEQLTLPLSLVHEPSGMILKRVKPVTSRLSL